MLRAVPVHLARRANRNPCSRSPSAGSALRRVCFATVCRAPYNIYTTSSCTVLSLWVALHAARARTNRAPHRAPRSARAQGDACCTAGRARVQWYRMAFNGREWPCMLPPTSPHSMPLNAFYFRTTAAWHGVHAYNAPDAPLLIFRQNPGSCLRKQNQTDPALFAHKISSYFCRTSSTKLA